MRKQVYELRKNVRARAVLKGRQRPGNESTDEQINPSQCIHCGAELPRDPAFQELHYQKEHGVMT